MFGLVFIVVLAVATVYAIWRTLHERHHRQRAGGGPELISFAEATRLANAVAHAEKTALRDRLAADAGTVRLVTALQPDGTPAPDQQRDPGSATVDIKGSRAGRHRRAAP